MPIQFGQLVRDSLLKPRDAARALLGVSLSDAVILQGALLSGILSVIALIAVYTSLATISPEVQAPHVPMIFADVTLAVLTVFVTSFVVVVLAKGVNADVSLRQSLTFYIWFGMVESGMMIAISLALFLLGPVGILSFLAAGVWGIWAMGLFWTILLQRDGYFTGLLVIILASLIAVTILSILAAALNLPVMELPTDV